jgi:transposase
MSLMTTNKLRNDQWTKILAFLRGNPHVYVGNEADRGYDSDELIEFILKHGAIPIIPPRKNRKTLREYDTWRYRERALVECFINKIKYYRHLFSRFDKLARRSLAFLHFAGTLIWLR